MIREVIKSGLLLVLVIILTTCSKGYVNYYSNKTCVIKSIIEENYYSGTSTVNDKNQITRFEIFDKNGSLESTAYYEYNSDGKVNKTKWEKKKTKGKYYVTYEYTGNNLTKTYYFNYDTLSGNFSEVSYNIYYYNKTKITKIETYGIKDTIPSEVNDFTVNSDGNITQYVVKKTSRTDTYKFSKYDSKRNPFKGVMLFNFGITVNFFNNNNPGYFEAGDAFYLDYNYNYDNYPTKISGRNVNSSSLSKYITCKLDYYCQ